MVSWNYGVPQATPLQDVLVAIALSFLSMALKKCLKICKNKYETEYSGNATLKNIKKISNTGINRISVGAITHSAKSFDVSLELSS